MVIQYSVHARVKLGETLDLPEKPCCVDGKPEFLQEAGEGRGACVEHPPSTGQRQREVLVV